MLVLIMLWFPLQGAIAAIMPLCVQAKQLGANLDIPSVTAACDLHHDDDRSAMSGGSAPHDPTFNLPCESVPCFTSFSAILPSAYAALIFVSGSSYSASFNSRFTSIILQQPQHPPLA
ncbi:MAG: hypothetical protein H0U72_06585 [Nitrosospira sp.]|nr:hypothetical protein [Nitrosospira sp.]